MAARDSVHDLKLEPGERLLWQGTPVYGQAARRRRKSGLLFFLAWIAFAVFWTVKTWQVVASTDTGLSWLFPLFGAGFILVGVVQFLRLLASPRAAPDRQYAVSNRRVIIAGTGPLRRIDALPLADIDEPQIEAAADGLADLYFARRQIAGIGPVSRRPPFCFMSIRDAGAVLELIQAARRGDPERKRPPIVMPARSAIPLIKPR